MQGDDDDAWDDVEELEEDALPLGFQESDSIHDSDKGNESDEASSSMSGSDEVDVLNPAGVPEWVMTIPQIPDQFSAKEFTKSYSLKAYDHGKVLRKELKKLTDWWTRARNSERKKSAVNA